MTLLQILCALGAPSALVTVFALVIRTVRSVKLGVQALLRAQMIADYNKWEDRGYAPIYARENFENCWVQYHTLGANGVMDDIHRRFMALPTEEKE